LNPTATASLLLSFDEEIALVERGDGTILLRSAAMEVPMSMASPGMLAALHALRTDGATEDQLVRHVCEHDGDGGLPPLFRNLDRFFRLGMIRRTLVSERGKVATILSSSPSRRYTEVPLPPGARYRLSRFAMLHREGERLLLESPLSDIGVAVDDPHVLLLLHELSAPRLLRELQQRSELSCRTVELLIGLLLSGDMVTEDQAEEHSPMAEWSIHDLLFHARSRLGRHGNPYGATFPFLGAVDPLSAVAERMPSDAIELYRPDLDLLMRNDPPLTRALEERQSIREHGTSPITVARLGEFLYRTARVRSIDTDRNGVYQRSSRPYPSAGACYELEIYPVVDRCDGLAPGLYRYAPLEHRLHRITGRTSQVEALLKGASGATGSDRSPQVLIVIAARFGRVAWKYQSIAYALTLKHVGVLYQTMYLVATAMDLAPCALGGGDSDLFAEAAGTDYYAETSVGEFTLGSRKQ
jgi:SagB-type dehydrogenase family enzyme